MIRLLNKLRTWFLSPDSHLELGLRTLYHKILATKFAFSLQDWFAKRSYQKWRRKNMIYLKNEDDKFDQTPLVSFIVFCPEGHHRECVNTINSIKKLEGASRELILFMPGGDHAFGDYLDLSGGDQIQTVTGQLENIFEIVIGEFLVFCAAGDQFYEALLPKFYQYLDNNPAVDLVYYDCEYYDEENGQMMPHFKPEKFSPELLLSINYLSGGFFRIDTIRKLLESIAYHEDFFALEYDLAFRLFEQSAAIMHMPFVLVEQTNLVTPDDEVKQSVVAEYLSRQGLTEVRVEKHNQLSRFIWKDGDPSTTIIILTKNHQQYLENLLESIFIRTTNTNSSITIVDNGSDDQDTLAYYEKIAQEKAVTIIPYNKPFNYSEAINLGVKFSDSDLLLLLNDDMLVQNSSWLTELRQWAIRPEIGVVGAKLLRRNHTIQHAGIIMGLNGFAGHIYMNAPEYYWGLFGSVDWYRNVLAVTGACQMVRRDVFEAVGGYDTGYKLAFGDIDFCLRVHKLGYRNMITPFATLFHYEGLSRGYTTPTSDILKGLKDMEDILLEGDPYYSTQLTLTRIPKCDLSLSTKETRKRQIESRKAFFATAHENSKNKDL